MSSSVQCDTDLGRDASTVSWQFGAHTRGISLETHPSQRVYTTRESTRFVSRISSDDSLAFTRYTGCVQLKKVDVHVGTICSRNKIKYRERLNERIDSSLQNNELIFDPYDAGQLREAEAKVDRRSVMRSIEGLTLQDHLALVALVMLESQGETPARTRHVYATYRNVCSELETNDISLDRVRDHLKELDLLGVTQYTIRTAGSEGGRKYFWELNTDLGATINVLDSIDRLDGVLGLVT